MSPHHMLEEHPKLLEQLQHGWTLRSAVRLETGMERGISAMLKRWAAGVGCVVERRNEGQPDQVLYHLRPAVDGEDVGTLWDLVQAQA